MHHIPQLPVAASAAGLPQCGRYFSPRVTGPLSEPPRPYWKKNSSVGPDLWKLSLRPDLWQSLFIWPQAAGPHLTLLS